MSSLRKMSLALGVALVAMALTAASASADIVNSSGTYVGPVTAVNTGPAPTLESGSTVVTCQTATTDGTIDGNAPATGELNFAWDDCSANGGLVSCTVDDITGVSVAFDEANAPDATILNTEAAGTQVVCGSIFQCNASSDPQSSQVSAEVDSDTQIVTIDDTVDVQGLIGCGGDGQWVAQYQITEPTDPLFATG